MALSDRDMFRSFAHYNFRLLFPAGLVSNIGNWAQMVAQDWLVLELTHSAFALSWATFLQLLPSLLFSVPAGLIADRYPKRLTLIFTNGTSALAALVMGLLVQFDVIQLWHVLALAFALGTASAIDGPVRQAFNTELVGQNNIANAVSLNSTSFNIARLIGPALSGVLITAFGTGPSFLINAFSYVFFIIALGMLRVSELQPQKRPTGKASIRQGWDYIWARPDLRAVLLVVFFTSSFGLNFNFFNAMMVTKVFNQNATVFGSLGTVVAFGSLTAAVLSTKFEHLRTPGNVLRGAAKFGVIIIAMSVMPSLSLYTLVLPLAGLTVLTTMIGANSCMQVHTDAAIRGRVLAWYIMAFNAPFAQPLLGWIAELIGVRATLALAGAITASAAVIVALTFKGRLARPGDYSVEAVLDSLRRV